MTPASIKTDLIYREHQLQAMQQLEMAGMFSQMRTATECRRIVGAEWFREAVRSGNIVGVRCGKRVKYHLGKLLARQLVEIRQAERQVQMAKEL